MTARSYTSQSRSTTVSRPSALARAEHGRAPTRLTGAQRKVLDQALRLGEDLREELESKTLDYGRWLLEEVFANDTTAALDEKSKNPIWQELVRRAGGPTLGVSQHLLYVALRIAAHDRRIAAEAWRGLDAGRKELLLPLGDESAMRAAAKHVAEMNLSQKKTEEYVRGLRAKSAKPRAVRLTAGGFVSRVRRVRDTLGGAAIARKVRGLELEPTPREAAVVELEKLRDAIGELLRALNWR